MIVVSDDECTVISVQGDPLAHACMRVGGSVCKLVLVCMCVREPQWWLGVGE